MRSRSIHRLALFAVPFAWFAPAARAQQELWRFTATLRTEEFGAALVRLPDLDGDGVAELAVGAPAHGGSLEDGRVRLLSGRDLALLRELRNDGPSFATDRFGAALALTGDFDRDGVQDLLVGAANRDAAFVHSLLDGRELARFGGGSSFGSEVVALGDLDRDGHDEVAVGAPDEEYASGRFGVVRVLTGGGGAPWHTWNSATDAGGFGGRHRLDGIDDVDQDGVRDLLLLDTVERQGVLHGVAVLRNPLSGQELLRVPFDHGEWLDHEVTAIAALDDQDGDGVPDFVVGGPHRLAGQASQGFVLSGVDGHELFRLAGTPDARFVVVGASPDHDGDGRRELLLASEGAATTALPHPSLRLFHGGDGALVAERIAAAPDLAFARAFVAHDDLDGDGAQEIVVGVPDQEVGGGAAGRVEAWSWSGSATLAARDGVARDDAPGTVAAQVGDVDGDGSSDVAAYRPDFTAANGVVELRSGRDGASLATWPTGGRLARAVAGMPDLDGDGSADVAIAYEDAIDLVATATGATIRTLAGPGGGWGNAVVLLPVVQPGNGLLQLFVGAAESNHGNPVGGEIDMFDVASGTMRFRKLGNRAGERLGHAVLLGGDRNGDGYRDWIVGAPKNNANGTDAGRIVVLSGAHGAQLTSFAGAAGEELGTALAALHDVDQDGADDFAAGAPGVGPIGEGEVRVLSLKSGALLQSFFGSGTGDRLGERFAALRDLNGDGHGDWAQVGANPARVELWSGLPDSLMASFPAVDHVLSALSAPNLLPELLPGSANGDAHADLLLVDPGTGVAGQLVLIALDDLLLQVTPPIALVGDIATSAIRGGVPGNPVVLELATIDGVRYGGWLDYTTLDYAGMHVVSDTVPPGLAGHSIGLRGFALDVNWKLRASPMQLLTFE